MNSFVKWGLIAFVVLWVIKDPASAGLEVQKLIAFAGQAASSLATAISNA